MNMTVRQLSEFISNGDLVRITSIQDEVEDDIFCEKAKVNLLFAGNYNKYQFQDFEWTGREVESIFSEIYNNEPWLCISVI